MNSVTETQSSLLVKVYSYSLVGLLFLIPLLEAPKNLLSLVVLISGGMLIYKHRLPINNYAKILFLWIVIGIIVSVHSVMAYELSGSGCLDILRFAGVGVVVSILGTQSVVARTLVFAAVLGCAIAALYSGYQIWSGTSDSVSLKSVGHVNHSAIYLQLSFVLGSCYLFFAKGALVEKACLASVVFILPIFIFMSHSRAAIAAMLICALGLFAWIVWKQYWKLLAGVVILAMAVGVFSYDSVQQVLGKHQNWVENKMGEDGYEASPRGQINRISRFVAKENILLGVGLSNYVDYINGPLQALLDEKDIELDVDPHIWKFHPHSLYMDYLASSGVVGMIPFVLFWGALLMLLYRHRPSKLGSNGGCNHWYWAVALGIVFSNLAIGVFNNPLHHESALLSLIMLSLFVYSTQTDHPEVKGVK